MGDYAFGDCDNLSNVTILEGVTRIGFGAFACDKGSGSLTSVRLPNSLTNIDIGAFARQSNLTDVYYQGTEAEWNAITIATDDYFGYTNDCLLNATIHFAE